MIESKGIKSYTVTLVKTVDSLNKGSSMEEMIGFLLRKIVVRVTFFGLMSFSTVGLAGQTLLLTGSSTIAPLAKEFGKAFETKNKGTRVDIQTGGSSRGLADLRKGLNHIAMVSRSVKKEENLRHFPVARDGIAIIVHSDNPISSLTTSQVRNIYQGKVKNWRQIGVYDKDIVVIHKAAGRSTQEVFSDYFKLKNRDIHADIIVGDNQQAIKTVASSPQSIGYVSIGSVLVSQKLGVRIKLVTIDGIIPNVKNVESGDYPIVRELNFVTVEEPKGLSSDFIEFSTSLEVHHIVRRLSFIPILKR